ncbi:hypothetical protein CHS0354_042223 [Potamilus streckersoni]|uniref:G protein gamma domain-containing protein n=1 Tax=Potamilus streckersoni TaxID=2493646 RepID=A0AAE0TLI5_9BIVA|nr:hypothetical protein CHS0354_042223 [Potamilus streckersoni]
MKFCRSVLPRYNLWTSRISRVEREIIEQRQQVEQLRQEAGIQRTRLSDALSDLIKYIQSKEGGDPLVKGFVKDSENPFKEPGRCSVA